MSKITSLVAIVCPLAFVVAGCGSSRQVDVTGTTSLPATESSAAPIHLDFYDVVKGQTDRKLVHSKDLSAPGKFEEKVDVEGDAVHVFALADTNANGKCDAGEAWAAADAPVKSDGTIDPLTLSLIASPCPADPSGASAAAPSGGLSEAGASASRRRRGSTADRPASAPISTPPARAPAARPPARR